ncbi:MAG: hypothetical protein JSV18_06905 [Candidatus Bathyarchaeota archaeon]|nr:MAG: hypothetical protein JSV18_06905 [Candidatus Bathyarchaeota archaeon]
MRSTTEIDTERLAREAKGSEHNEAYQPMGKLDGISMGVGARATTQGEPAFFIEVLIPVCSGSQVDLDRLEGRLEILRRLEERRYSLTCQDDMILSCELKTRGEELEGEYERAISIVARS